MCSTQVSTSDRAAGLNAAPPWRVLQVQPMPGCRLSVQFQDGTSGEVDMSALVQGDRAGIFAVLRDVAVFNAVHVEFGAVAWPGDVDLAPDALHAAIKMNGQCVLSPDGLFG
ncbi:DUF2442 domain-containing protein [Dyella acidiphila]|uniref:DUF2442 domain-containing protein n=1 Tax=Dyella acidiphila TaxID=2775866 RepID=A0ABR9G9C8_9GAMM|nr:DUF2442 domain-containing protein [Dyella acidiphila]MBE1160646.1 DUF2442 domain-containing protein [Dyella acidiphila]